MPARFERLEYAFTSSTTGALPSRFAILFARVISARMCCVVPAASPHARTAYCVPGIWKKTPLTCGLSSLPSTLKGSERS